MISDSRRLSDLAVTDFYPMKNTRKVLDRLERKRILSVSDLTDRFFEEELHNASRKCFAIQKLFLLLQCSSIPQELKNFSETFRRTVNSTLGEHKKLNVLAFLENARAETSTEEKHLASLEVFQKILLQRRMILKLSWCSFGVQAAKGLVICLLNRV